jgi:dipeptidyl aminopeptidase/acylaminoacyl peptidase
VQAVRYEYGPNRHAAGELRVPEGAGPHPVVVLFHGGFWRSSWTLQLMDRVAVDLAGRGWASWNVEYRRTGFLAGGGWPATFDDVAAAVDHVAVLATHHPLDLHRVSLLGHSAGGHLALWAAARSDSAVQVQRAVAMAGIPDLVRCHHSRVDAGAVAKLMGGPPERVPERYGEASPFARLPLAVSQVLIHGEDDNVVPPEFSRAYVEAATAAGDDARLVVVPAENHFACLDPATKCWLAAVEALEGP